MSVPTQRRTKGYKKNRASHFALSTPNTKKCEKCGEIVLHHRACTNCGTYKGRQVIDTSKKLKKATKKK